MKSEREHEEIKGKNQKEKSKAEGVCGEPIPLIPRTSYSGSTLENNHFFTGGHIDLVHLFLYLHCFDVLTDLVSLSFLWPFFCLPRNVR